MKSNKESTAPLSASQVAEACYRVLGEIRRERKRTIVGMAIEMSEKSRRWWRPFGLTVEECLRRLPSEQVELVEDHRADEASQVSKLMALAEAADDMGANFTVMVSTSDYALIEHKYLEAFQEASE